MPTFLSVGSNVATTWGDPRANVEGALKALVAAGVAVLGRSRVYRTMALGPVAQDDFANMVVEVGAVGGVDALVTNRESARDLLGRCQAVESEFGRRRDVKMGPRTLDLDILIHGDAIVESEELTVPHPRMCERRFVLVPLAELAPDAWHPARRRTAKQLLQDLQAGLGMDGAQRVTPWTDVLDGVEV